MHKIESNFCVGRMVDFCWEMRCSFRGFVVKMIEILPHGASEDNFVRFGI